MSITDDSTPVDADFALVRAWLGGDAESGRSLVSKHYQPLYAFFRSRFGVDEAADLTQSVFEVFCQRASGLEVQTTVRAFLFAIARFKSLEFSRRRRLAQARCAAYVDPLDSSTTVGTALDRRRRESRAVQFFRTLPADDLTLIELKVVDRVTNREVAEMLQIPQGTVASRLRRLRSRLSASLSKGASSPETLTRVSDILVALSR